jgi:hypothetical protein
MILIPPSIEKCIFACSFGATSSPSCTPTKSNLHFEIYSATALSEPALYILLTFEVPNLISIFFHLGCLSKESVWIRGFLWSFVTSLFLWWRVVSPTPNPQAGGPPLIGCPRLLFQYIRSYPPYLEAVSSIHNLRMRHAMVTRDPPNMERIRLNNSKGE